MNFKSALIVDDSKLARITLRKKLSSYGLTVTLAESGKEAIDSLVANIPDIIFMDHLMPEMDGFEAAAKIRTMPEYAAIPIIMCTGKEHEGYLEEAQAIGANQILSKPPVDEALEKILGANFAVPTPVVDIPMATPAEAPTVLDEVEELDLGDLGLDDLGLDLADDIAAIDESIAGFGDLDMSSISLNDDASSVVQSVEDMGDLSDLGTNVFVGGHIADSQPAVMDESVDVPAIDEVQIAALISQALAAEVDKLRADFSKQVDHLQMQLEAQENAEPVATEATAINRDELVAVSKEVLQEEKVGLVADVIAALPGPMLTGLSDKGSEVDTGQLQSMVSEQLSIQLQDVQQQLSQQMQALETKLAELPLTEAQSSLSIDDVKLVVQAEVNQLKAEVGMSSVSAGESEGGVISEERLQQLEILVAQQLAANKAATEGLINEALEDFGHSDESAGSASSVSAPSDLQETIDMLTEQQQLMYKQQQLPKSLSSIAMVLGLSALALSIFMFIR